MNLTAASFLLCLALGVGFLRPPPVLSRQPARSGILPPLGKAVAVPEPRTCGSRRACPPPTDRTPPARLSGEEEGVRAELQHGHGSSLRGGANEFAAPALAGPFFYEKWSGRPLGELFRYAVENMPPDQTRLSEGAYLDVMAYVLQVLKHPAGNTDLTADSPAMKRSIEAPR